MSNQGFNEIMEATLTSAAKDKLIQPDSARLVVELMWLLVTLINVLLPNALMYNYICFILYSMRKLLNHLFIGIFLGSCLLIEHESTTLFSSTVFQRCIAVAYGL